MKKAIFIEETTFKGKPIVWWRCPACKGQFKRTPEDDNTTTRCVRCKEYLRLER